MSSQPRVALLRVVSRLGDHDTVACTVWGEGRNQDVGGQIAIGSVIRNRVKLERFGRGWKRVCLRRWQFSCWEPGAGQSNHARVLALARALADGRRIDEADEHSYAVALAIADGIVDGAVGDSVCGATHYITKWMWETDPPAWANGKRPCAEAGDHVFFRGIA